MINDWCYLSWSSINTQMCKNKSTCRVSDDYPLYTTFMAMKDQLLFLRKLIRCSSCSTIYCESHRDPTNSFALSIHILINTYKRSCGFDNCFNLTKWANNPPKNRHHSKGIHICTMVLQVLTLSHDLHSSLRKKASRLNNWNEI